MTTETEKATDVSRVFAEDVLFVYRYLGRRLTKRRAGTHARYELHSWVHENAENRLTFIKTLVPKAQDTLLRFKEEESSQELVLHEKKAVRELQMELREAVLASKSITPDSQIPEPAAPSAA